MATKTVADIANKAISQRDQAREHPLEMAAKVRAADDSGALEAQYDASWEHLPAEQRSATMANVDVYLDDFILVVQGEPRERCKMLWQLSHQIDRVFRPNKELDTYRKYPISQKNLG